MELPLLKSSHRKVGQVEGLDAMAKSSHSSEGVYTLDRLAASGMLPGLVCRVLWPSLAASTAPPLILVCVCTHTCALAHPQGHLCMCILKGMCSCVHSQEHVCASSWHVHVCILMSVYVHPHRHVHVCILTDMCPCASSYTPYTLKLHVDNFAGVCVCILMSMHARVWNMHPCWAII